MNDASGSNLPVRASANEIRERAAEWLVKHQEQAWSAQDQASLENWFAQDAAHRIAYLRLETAWGTADRLTVLRRPMREEFRARKPDQSRSSAVKVAAVAGFAALLIAAAYWPRTADKVYATGLGGREIVTLADGSQIELNTNTEIRSAAVKGARQFLLVKGEAYFQVHHDAARPFVVTIGEHRIVDIGTKFLVRRDTNQVQVSLLEGSARLETTRGAIAKAAVLMPGDIAIATADAVSVMKKPAQDLSSELGWRRGVLVFRRTTLGDAAAEFNRYSREKLVISDPEVASLTISGTFPVGGIQLFSRAARESFGLSVSHKGEETFISKLAP